jgi:hypothetical protein
MSDRISVSLTRRQRDLVIQAAREGAALLTEAGVWRSAEADALSRALTALGDKRSAP